MYTVGQKLYFVPGASQLPHEVTITKVGRKWLYCRAIGQTIRVDVATLRPHEDDDSGQLYHDHDEYDQWIAMSIRWDEFRRMVAQRYSEPQGMTIEKIQQATALLFGEES